MSDDDNEEDDDDEDPNNGTGVATGKVSNHKNTKANSPIVINSDDDFINDHFDLFEDDVHSDGSESEVSPSNHTQEQRSSLVLRRGIVRQVYQVPRTFNRKKKKSTPRARIQARTSKGLPKKRKSGKKGN